jgi:site-specific DNA-methyltransferase (adenine-specific)
MNIVLNCDCMAFMRAQKDCIMILGKRWEFKNVLAVPDPPYGNGEEKSKNETRNKCARAKKYKAYKSERPDSDYFKHLFKISADQIIWGGNYFINDLYDTPCLIVWDKENEKSDYADCEIAWTSFDTVTRKFKFRWNGMLQGNMKNKEVRIHRHQKPVALYRWLLQNYAKPGQLIFDSHVGSGSIRIACHDLGFDFVGCEKDSDYWEAQEKRYREHIAQGELIPTKEIQEAIWQQKKCF